MGATKFVQMMISGWLLTFIGHDQVCFPMCLYGENVEKLFSQNTFAYLLLNQEYLAKHFSYGKNI